MRRAIYCTQTHYTLAPATEANENGDPHTKANRNFTKNFANQFDSVFFFGINVQ